MNCLNNEKNIKLRKNYFYSIKVTLHIRSGVQYAPQEKFLIFLILKIINITEILQIYYNYIKNKKHFKKVLTIFAKK